jgi:hypothetical protein
LVERRGVGLRGFLAEPLCLPLESIDLPGLLGLVNP